MTPDELAEGVWWSAGKRSPWRSSGTTDYPVLLINDASHALVNRITGWGDSRGGALRGREVPQAIKQLRSIRRLSARGKTVIDSLSEDLKQFERTGVALVQDGPDRECRDRIIRHECFHLFQYRKRLQKRPAANALIRQTSTSKALPYLRKHGYDVGDSSLVVFEMAAYIFSDGHAFIGLGRREAEDWFSAYCREHAVSRDWLGPLKTGPTV